MTSNFELTFEDGTNETISAQPFFDWVHGEGKNFPAVSLSQQLSCFTGRKVAKGKRVVSSL